MPAMEANNSNAHRHCKIAVMGYPSVGKSSLAQQYVFGRFPDVYDTTIEDIHRKNVQLGKRKYNLEIVDTAGQQEYSMHPKSCTVTDGYILVYSIDDSRSFEVVSSIHDRIMERVGEVTMPIVLVGNKLDLDSRRAVDTDEAQRTAARWKADFIEISAREKQQVDIVFEKLLRLIERDRLGPNATNKEKGCSVQ